MVKTDKRGTKYYVGAAIAICFMFLFGKIVPTWGEVTEAGVGVIGTFLGILIAIITTGDLLWPSIVAMAALTLHGYFPNFAGAVGGVFGIQVVYGRNVHRRTCSSVLPVCSDLLKKHLLYSHFTIAHSPGRDSGTVYFLTEFAIMQALVYNN